MQEHSAADCVALKDLTSIRIGGRPSFYARPAGITQLRAALEHCRRAHMPIHIMGGGTNLLVADGRLPFAVIHISAPGFNLVRRTGPMGVRVGAGVATTRLLAYCRRKEMGGLEFMAGIPGTLGGALAGNAGAWDHSIAERILCLRSMDLEGCVKQRSAEEIPFGYRRFGLPREIIIEAEFHLEPRPSEEIARRMSDHVRQKSLRHPVDARSAGCIFKNPKGAPAGLLIDKCGLKGAQVGGAVVSARHANFICNVADASAADVVDLIDMVRRAVRDRFGVELEMEVKHWPADTGRARPSEQLVA